MCGLVKVDRPPRARPRSADVGGLFLATGSGGQGQGWMGHDVELNTRFAELLSDMYNETLNAVNEREEPDFTPADLPTKTRSRLIDSLGSWGFEPHKLPEEEVLSCTMLLFEALFRIEGMEEVVGISLTQMSPFIRHLRQIYRWENSYHNFEHALDVLQASYTFLHSAGLVPPLSILLDDGRLWRTHRAPDSGPLMTSLGPLELFVVYIAAIGHDVGHPGFTNLFMRNAETPLSVVFGGKSALEGMHISLLLRIMRHHGLGHLLDSPTQGHHFRTLLWETVMATDMSVHPDFMKSFQHLISGVDGSICTRQILICQAIMKCADISNPSRPYHVSQHWATALVKEWTCQAELERTLELPTTVQSSDDPLSEAKSQVFFINFYAKPLLELVVQAVPEMRPYLNQCISNHERWTARVLELESLPVLPVTPSPQRNPTPLPSPSPRAQYDYLNAFPLTLPPRCHDSNGLWPGRFYASTTGTEASSSTESFHTAQTSSSIPCSPSSDSVTSFTFSPDSSASDPEMVSSTHASGDTFKNDTFTHRRRSSSRSSGTSNSNSNSNSNSLGMSPINGLGAALFNGSNGHGNNGHSVNGLNGHGINGSSHAAIRAAADKASAKKLRRVASYRNSWSPVSISSMSSPQEHERSVKLEALAGPVVNGNGYHHHHVNGVVLSEEQGIGRRRPDGNGVSKMAATTTVSATEPTLGMNGITSDSAPGTFLIEGGSPPVATILVAHPVQRKASQSTLESQEFREQLVEAVS